LFDALCDEVGATLRFEVGDLENSNQILERTHLKSCLKLLKKNGISSSLTHLAVGLKLAGSDISVTDEFFFGKVDELWRGG
jgi:hypothetical protein